MPVRVRVSGGGGDDLCEEMAVAVENVVAVPPQMRLANKRFGVARAKRGGGAARRDIVWVDVVRGRGEERRRLDEDDLTFWDVRREKIDDL